MDDGSTDGTEEVVRAEFGEQVQYHYQPNQGPSIVCNYAVRLCPGDWVAFLDADDWWMPENLELQVAEISQHPEAGMVGCEGLECSLDGRELRHFSEGVPFLVDHAGSRIS